MEENSCKDCLDFFLLISGASYDKNVAYAGSSVYFM